MQTAQGDHRSFGSRPMRSGLRLKPTPLGRSVLPSAVVPGVLISVQILREPFSGCSAVGGCFSGALSFLGEVCCSSQGALLWELVAGALQEPCRVLLALPTGVGADPLTLLNGIGVCRHHPRLGLHRRGWKMPSRKLRHFYWKPRSDRFCPSLRRTPTAWRRYSGGGGN